MGLNDFEFSRICELLEREPSYTELGMFAVMWSEHCGYKYSRPVLNYFKKYKEAMEGDGLENAGVVPLGDGWGVTMKIESHNHPSAVEPYQGAATGVGGIIRDIFTMGARPIASLNSLRFGPIHDGGADPEVVKRNRYLFSRVVAGIGGYGNCVGVPTVGGEVSFHPRYSGNPLVNAMSVGMVRMDEIATAGAGGPGNPVIYMGSATGRDGIHGATFASDALGEDNEDKRPNVQIGDPFAEKLLIEATLEALRTGAVHSIQDMGAAGLTCSTIEMSSKGGVGMTINLDMVPARENDMSGYELMLSESQERMLAVAHRGREQEVLDVFRKWGIHAVVIGEVTANPVVTIRRHGEVIAEVNPKLLTDFCPTYTSPSAVPDYFREATSFDIGTIPVADLAASLKALMGSANLSSRRWVYQQYDQEVQTQTAFGPSEADGAVLAPRGTERGLSFSVDGNGRWVYLDPYVGGQLAVCEAARNVACTGALPTAVTDGLNYGNPQQPHIYWQFDESVRGIADAAEALGTPVISGNVSFYNESDLGEVLPTPLIGMLGVIKCASNRKPSKVTGKNSVALLLYYSREIAPQQGLGASSYLAEVHGVENGRPLSPDLPKERDLCNFLVAAAEQNLFEAAHDCSEGGLVFALAELCVLSHCGAKATTDIAAMNGLERADARWFGEFPGQVVVAASEQNVDAILKLASSFGLEVDRFGTFTGDNDALDVDNIHLKLGELSELYEGCIPSVMSGK